MAIRLRKVGNVLVALCAAETYQMEGDLYLDDDCHYALAAKFAKDYWGERITAQYPSEWAAMESQKMRDARKEIEKWTDEHHG